MENSATAAAVLVILIAVLHLVGRSEADARAETVLMKCMKEREHNTTIYVSNFVATMENISNKVRTSGFGTAVSGSGLDANYGLAECYGDLTLLDCVLCYAQARTLLPQCYPFNGGRIYLEGCFMRAENYSFFEEYTGPEDTAVCGNTTLNSNAFRDSARQAVMNAASDAVKNSDYFARGKVKVSASANQSVYVLANCWRTLNVSSCKACLQNAYTSIMGCLPSSEGWALNTGCFMRYSDMDFLNPEPKTGNSEGRNVVIITAVFGSAIVFVVGAFFLTYIWRHLNRERKRRGSNDAVKLAKTLNDSSLNFKYSTIEKATDSFADANKLGQGGFGTVYRGVLQDGREIAVKRLFFNNRHRAANFYNEVNIISSVEHKNLVRLLGCSCSGPESLLIYEFLPNKSLDIFIFDSTRGKELNWEKRFDIITGTAEGLVYLHENNKNRIIHRDIKASNILLDSRFRAKIADFGLARSFQENKSHISTAIAGTLGYMAPEYLAHGHLTEKADVYSFGVLLLEIVTGRQNNRSKSSEYSDSLVSIAWRHFQQRKADDIIDPNLMMVYYPNSNLKQEILRVVHIALLCIQENPSLRPSMSMALRFLKTNEPLPESTNPPFIDENTMELNDLTKNLNYHLNGDHSASIVNVSYSEFYPR